MSKNYSDDYNYAQNEATNPDRIVEKILREKMHPRTQLPRTQLLKMQLLKMQLLRIVIDQMPTTNSRASINLLHMIG
jgi:hypothetical protein